MVSEFHEASLSSFKRASALFSWSATVLYLGLQTVSIPRLATYRLSP